MVFYDLSKRLILSAISLAVAIGLIIFAYIPFVQIIIAILIAGMTGIALFEYGKLMQLDKKRCLYWLMISLGTLLSLSFFLYAKIPNLRLLPLSLLIGSGIVFFILHFSEISGASAAITKAFFGLCYIAIPLGLLFLILYQGKTLATFVDRRFLLFYLIAVTKVTDIAAYFGGRLWGKKKLAPKLSPKKTIAGAIIGLFTAVVLSFLFYLASRQRPNIDFHMQDSLILGILLGGLGQIGDLAESLFKREAAVKDSNSLPGFGGVLDLLDSLLFTIPIFYLFLGIH